MRGALPCAVLFLLFSTFHSMPDYDEQHAGHGGPKDKKEPADPFAHGQAAEVDALDDAADDAGHADQDDMAAELARLERDIATLKDENLRAQAEVQNTRRRAEEEMAKARKFAISNFAESLLAVLDSLEAALAVQNASAEQLREGTVATHRQLLGVLQRNAVVEINPAAGEKFDPTQQHAISTVETSEQPAGTVVSVMQKGYVLAGRVLRPALVTVAQSG